MEESLVTQVSRYLKSQRRRKIGYQVLTCMASVVVFCTVYALILPAITISNEMTCGLEQHEHDESCYAMAAAAAQPELICDTSDLPGLLLHTHNDYCYDNDGNLICTLKEREAHTHGGSCYQEHLNLICDQVQEMGHAHTSACYARDRDELICTIPEGEGQHTHTDDCLRVEEKRVLACGRAETPAHTHDENCETVRSKKVLVCTESEAPAHTHDSSCYDVRSREVLSCGQSEAPAHSHSDSCYTVRTREVLTCTESESPPEYDEEGNLISAGHSHSGSCCTTEEERSLTCGQKETAGHTHSADCYKTEEERTLTCTQSTEPAHRHTDACYETVEETVRTCTLQEGSGHTHDESCYKTETETTVLCGQEEGQGHVHGDSCYTWTERLICTQEERPAGHIHDDSCYEKETVLACRQMEIEEHTHGEGCYSEEGELTCTRREVSRHQHTAACVHIPESTGEEVPTLICGKEEHIHNETCYVDIVPPEDQEFFCGIPAHTHTEECYFEDGVTLRCTMPEHIHTEECREPEVPEEPKYAGAEGVELDNDFIYENDAFLVKFHISGYAPLLYDSEVMTLEENDTFYSYGPEAESAPPPSGESVSAPESTPVPEPASAPADPTASAPAEVPPDVPAAEDEAGSADGDFGGFDGDGGYSVSAPAEEDTLLLSSADVEFTVEELAEDSREYRRMASHAEEYTDHQELPMLEVLTFSAEIDGQELDLTGCAVEVEITLSELLVEYLNSYSEGQTMAIGEDDVFDEPAGGESADESGFLLMTYSLERGSNEVNEIGAVNTAEDTTVNGQMGRNDDNKVAIALLPRIYPNYTIEFYANLDRPAIGAKPEGGSVELPFIDTSVAGNGTSGPVMPQNGGLSAKSTKMWIDTDGNVIFNQELKEIYKAKDKLIFNPLVETTEEQLTVKRLNALRDNPHYAVTALWVLQPGGDPENEDDWAVYPEEQLDDLCFTNNPRAAEANENVILIQQEGTENTILRLIYSPTEHTKDYGAVFYDYDVSDGLRSDGMIDVAGKGINSKGNYADDGRAKLGFGNGEGVLKTGLGDESWGGNTLNKSNANGFNGCTFGMVSRIGAGDTLIFDSTIDAPALFGDEAATGKSTVKGHSLRFNQEGDTYTLTAVTGTGTSGLESFWLKRPNWNNTKTIYSNGFWPMDDMKTEGKDPQFGLSTKDPNTIKTTGGQVVPESDDYMPHNHYFGMNFAVEFNLEKEYVGPLEYYFYGDDDMWVFLDNKDLICDIGGVHSAVGEYVDLWDYIPGGRENHAAGPHTLYFYYTERGASGSTCWMQFTLPNLVHLPVSTPPDETAHPLRIEKEVTGVNAPDPSYEYTFSIQLTGGMTNSFGGHIYDPNGENPEEPIAEVNDINCESAVTFQLKAGQYFEFYGGLPSFAGYIVKELRPDDLSEEVLATWRPSVDTIFDGGAPNTEAGTDASGTIGSHRVVLRYTNAFTYELPETGGTGSLWYTLTGALLPAATGGLWYRRKKSRREGAVD